MTEQLGSVRTEANRLRQEELNHVLPITQHPSSEPVLSGSGAIEGSKRSSLPFAVPLQPIF